MRRTQATPVPANRARSDYFCDPSTSPALRSIVRLFSSDVCPQMASEDWMRAIRSLLCGGALTSIHLPPSSRRMPGTPAGNLNSARVRTQGLAKFRLSLRCLSSR
jgi:hypothetical protein